MDRSKLLAAAFLVCIPLSANAQQGWYAGLDVGSARSDSKINEYIYILEGDATARASNTTTGFRLRGGYQFGRFFALEAAYVDFGESESHFDPDDCPFGAPGPCPIDVRASAKGIIGNLVFMVPIGESWFLGARLGYGQFEVDAEALGAVDLSESADNAAWGYGLSGGYRFKDHWEVLLDYSEYNHEDNGSSLSGDFGVLNLGETSVTSLGIAYHW